LITLKSHVPLILIQDLTL